MGEEMYAVSEEIVDKATAVSASGPAYLFYTVACFEKAAQSIGLSREDARRMVLKTFEGSWELLRENDDAEEMIRHVASKGGTTEAALAAFQKGKLQVIWKDAIRAAFLRAKKLSK